MSEVEHRESSGAKAAPSTALALQCFMSIAGTMVGEALGDTLVEKLLAGLLLCFIDAFLVAPGRHQRRRVVAVVLLLALLESLRRAGHALASSGVGARRPAIGTSPADGGKARRGSGVRLFVSSGSPGRRVRIPPVRGLREREARLLLEDLGLRVVRAGTPSEQIARGEATGSLPPADTPVSTGSRVTLLVSTGAAGDEQITVPEVTDLPERTALARLRNAGLDVRSTPQPSDDIANGRAIATDPPAGESVDRGTRVRLLVSSGSRVERVRAVARGGSDRAGAQTAQRSQPARRARDAAFLAAARHRVEQRTERRQDRRRGLHRAPAGFLRHAGACARRRRKPREEAQRMLTRAGLIPKPSYIESSQP